jgi:hypothetical protein
MSLTLVRPYFKARCLAVGLTEHTDVFNFQNVPSSIVDYSFHVEFFSANGVKLNQHDQEITIPCNVSFYVKGYRNPAEGMDKAIAKCEALIKEVLAPANRLGQCLKNVTLGSVAFEPIAASNDNSIKVQISFNVFTSLALV